VKDRLSTTDLSTITEATVGSYDGRADDFWLGTRDHDVMQNVHALLDAIQGEGPFRILDFGCGPGRDLATFKTLGHSPVGLEGSPRFCEMARSFSGCDVLHQNFLKLDLPADHFDGVFANATIFHVPGQELPRVLAELRTALKGGGVFFSSNPRGDNVEGWNGERYSSYHDLTRWRHFMQDAGFTELNHYYRPKGLPREHQPWLASVWRKVE
jgi:SAM-dependent methyltransferase